MNSKNKGGGGFELPVWTVNVASSLSSTQEVKSHIHVTKTNSAWIFQRCIHKQTSVNCNSLVK
jgi:succinylarginine dihydrolase